MPYCAGRTDEAPRDPPAGERTIVAHIYEVESPLGSGGFGATYLARNTTLKGGQVVVKQVASEDQGEEEAQVLVGLESANVVRVLAFDEKHRAIVMSARAESRWPICSRSSASSTRCASRVRWRSR